ncbi:YqjF family protein [Mycobacterium vicinigordonae]|uniref:DUF2071 domain-containing protein n=1 Tax=Mycobacterium vicinigordonae TaxID=1719132 RepID=A0A7D6DVN4_9MYCO|nr:DUF2071 domain-containing protein [Mycobacterium vicinigordonae]QLL05249.1 DUF2071 domain-containing protein [Mycobacterium vicinigordonae]
MCTDNHNPAAADPGDAAELSGYPVTPPALPRPVTFDQHWADLTFVHWPVHPESIAHMYPSGTRPDVFADGMTYVGLIPFAMSYTKVGSAVPLPYFGRFLETNVRLYSVDAAGHHGVLFRSLETARLAVVPVTRIGLGVPYTWAKMRMSKSSNEITYHSIRRWPRRGLRTLMTVTVGDVVTPTPLEVWLTARWGAHTRKAGQTWWIPNEHVQWPLQVAEVHELHDELVEAAGVHRCGNRLRALYSPGVRTYFGRPCLIH